MAGERLGHPCPRLIVATEPDELQRRNYSPNTVRSYLHAVEEFARHFCRSPEQLGPDHIRKYQVHLFRDRKLSARTVAGQTAALRFLFVKTLRRAYLPDSIPFPSIPSVCQPCSARKRSPG